MSQPENLHTISDVATDKQPHHNTQPRTGWIGGIIGLTGIGTLSRAVFLAWFALSQVSCTSLPNNQVGVQQSQTSISGFDILSHPATAIYALPIFLSALAFCLYFFLRWRGKPISLTSHAVILLIPLISINMFVLLPEVVGFLHTTATLSGSPGIIVFGLPFLVFTSATNFSSLQFFFGYFLALASVVTIFIGLSISYLSSFPEKTRSQPPLQQKWYIHIPLLIMSIPLLVDLLYTVLWITLKVQFLTNFFQGRGLDINTANNLDQGISFLVRVLLPLAASITGGILANHATTRVGYWSARMATWVGIGLLISPVYQFIAGMIAMLFFKLYPI